MWPFTRRPKTVVLVVAKADRNEAWDTKDSWPLQYHLTCLCCGNGFVRLGNKTQNPRFKAGRATCVKCGASRTLHEIHESVRIEKELQLKIEQEQKKIELLHQLHAVQAEREALEKGVKRVVEA